MYHLLVPRAEPLQAQAVRRVHPYRALRVDRECECPTCGKSLRSAGSQLVDLAAGRVRVAAATGLLLPRNSTLKSASCVQIKLDCYMFKRTAYTRPRKIFDQLMLLCPEEAISINVCDRSHVVRAGASE